MRDFTCCGNTLPSLHDLLQHYEEAHAQKPEEPPQRQPIQNADNRGGPVSQPPQGLQTPTAASPRPGIPAPKPAVPTAQPQNMQPQSGFGLSNMNDLSDLDTVGDMEMDDPLADTSYQQPDSASAVQSQYSQQESQSGRTTPMNLNLLQGQGFRSSQPGTPVPQTRPLQNNPTVSSVNTPTLMSNRAQQQQQQANAQFRTPDSSAPGTPAELDESVVGGFNGMSMQNNPLMGSQSQYPGFGGNNDMVELCIDEPAKRLFRPNGGFKQAQQNTQFRLSGAQYGPNSDVAQRIREQQRLAGVPDTNVGMKVDDEPKPFRCPVIGCEKAYKNQNGLKYHKSVCKILLLPLVCLMRAIALTDNAVFSMAITTSNFTTMQTVHTPS